MGCCAYRVAVCGVLALVGGAAGTGGAAWAAPVVAVYGPVTVTYYNNGDTDGTSTGQANWTAQQIADVEASVRVWTDRITNVPARQVQLHMFWNALPGGTLGSTSNPIVGNGTTAWSLTEYTWRVGGNFPIDADARIVFDTDAAGFNWTFGAGTPVGSTFDFRTVMIHEFGHAMGFSSAYNSSTDQWWSGGLTEWDKRLVDSLGNVAVAGGSGSPGNFNELDDPIYFNGTVAKRANGNALVPVYAPSPYQGGSSISHIDEATYGTSLMTPFLGVGQVTRVPSALEWSILKDLGWSVKPYWRTATSGTWATHERWNPYAAPVSTDQVHFALASSGYTVTVSATTSANRLTVNKDVMTLDVQSSRTLTISGFMQLAPVSGEVAHMTRAGGGTLSVPSVFVGGSNTGAGGSATLVVTGGTTSVSDTLQVYPGGTVTQTGGTLTVGSVLYSQGTVLLGGSQTAWAVPIVKILGGSVTLDVGGKQLTTTSLSMEPGAALDLNDGKLTVNGGDLAALHALLAEGYNGGAWNGAGIRSSEVAADNVAAGYGLYTLGAAPDVNNPANALVRYTYAGDANLDGQVDVTDLGALATWFNTSGRLYHEGDFNFDGWVDVSDLGILATNFQVGVGNPLGFVEALALFPAFEAVAVPEPAGVGLVMAGAVGVVMRRRRRGIR